MRKLTLTSPTKGTANLEDIMDFGVLHRGPVLKFIDNGQWLVVSDLNMKQYHDVNFKILARKLGKLIAIKHRQES